MYCPVFPLQAGEMEISGASLEDGSHGEGELPDAPASCDVHEPDDAKSLR